MAEKAKWWKAFLPKKKPGSARDSASTQAYGADFDPFAQDRSKESKPSGDQSVPQQEANNGSCLFSGETYDDSHMESLFNEQTCRRNLKVSRSGRHKQKFRARIALPFQEKGGENVAPAKDDVR